ncbi:MAG: flagellar hook-associated protein FlgK [Alcaligenaceae bacterium]|nr:flagellar hook-associated protein FlgK [Alcaligenaceae bacterium]
MNLANLGLTALNAAQNRLQTAGHNLNNATTDGYNRQSVLVQTAGAKATGAGYIGRGVQAVTVQRSYDGFLYKQLVDAQSKGASITSYGNEIVQINNLFADRSVGITPALQKFFDGIQAVASEPADSAARQELLGRAASLVGQINDANQFLNDQRGNINTQITTVVEQINSYVERIRDLNTRITTARASATGAHEPNDLLDQRDQLLSELNQLVGVKSFEQDGKVNLSIGNGQILLGGDTVYPLRAQPSADDPQRTVLAYTIKDNTGNVIGVELDESRIKGGTLAGLISYRQEALDAVQNNLGRLAMGLAVAVNEAHAQGVDLGNIAGGHFFTDFTAAGSIKAVPGSHNSAGAPSITVDLTDVDALTAEDYRISVKRDETTGAPLGYEITSIPSGAVTPGPALADTYPATVSLGGMAITFSAAPAPANVGDSWLIRPTRAAGADLSLEINDPANIAAAAPNTGNANGDNALAMAKLQTQKTLGNGSMSFNEAFSQIVNKVGVLTQQNGTEAKATASLIQQNYAAQQAVSGVNLNEEYVQLMQFQEQFRAASKLIDVSSSLFDTLLSLRT